MTNTTHYSYALPVVGGSQNVWGTLLNAIFASVDGNIWSASQGTTIGVNAPSASASPITLTNPINNIQNISFSGGSQSLILPVMNATASPVVGGTFVVNNVGSFAFEIFANDGSTAIVTSLLPGQSAYLTLLTSGTTNGTFNVVIPVLGTNGNVAISGNLSVAGTVSGVGFSNYLASPPAIGGSAPAAGSFTTLSASSTLSVTGASTLIGNVGIGAAASVTYAVKIVQGGANQAYLGSTGANSSVLVLDNAAGSQIDTVEFQDAGTAKWRLNKDTSNNFNLSDVANSKTFLTATAGSTLNLGSAQNSIVDAFGNLFLNTNGTGLNFNGVSYTAGVQISTGTNSSQIQIASGTATALGIQSTSGTGRVVVAFFNGTTSCGFIGSSPGVTTYNTTSDKRLKNHIAPLIDIGNKIDAIQPVTYNWQYIEGSPSGVGFLAQDLYEIFPEAVSVGDDGSVNENGKVAQQWAVDYSKLVPYLVTEIQSLRARLKAAGIA